MSDDELQAARRPGLRLTPGTLIDHFRVLRLLGTGGMSEVHLARDTRLGRKVALKLILGEQTDSPRLRRMFRAEAQATASFNHPNIVTIYHVGQHEESPYLALEYLEGETLTARYRRERPGLKEIQRIALDIAHALREAHDHGILHQDLKPGNVIITSAGRTKVLDFGLAGTIRGAVRRPAEVEDRPLAATGQRPDLDLTEQTLVSGSDGATRMEIKGTPGYIAPEVWKNEEDGTGAVDIWALGLVLYEVVTGRKLFTTASISELAAAVIDPQPVDLEAVTLASPSLADLVGRCLAKAPADRPTAEEVVVALEAMLQREQRAHPKDSCPFQGLLPFAEEHTAIFFGREDEVAAFVEGQRSRPVLPVVGPSGAGKSSFVQAGVIPRLREQGRWVVLALRPGTAPFSQLAAALLEAEDRAAAGAETPTFDLRLGATTSSGATNRGRVEQLADELLKSPGVLGLRLRQLAELRGARVLLFVDQLEELYTLTDDDHVRSSYMRATCLAADDPAEPVRVTFTVRDDSLGRVAELPEIREVLSHVTLLRSPGRDALREILVRPLEATGYSYDDPDLVDEMLDEVRDESACLPLLQFVTRMLWERRDTEAKLLLRPVYESMGGVGGALAEQADSVIEAMPPRQEGLARQLLLRLVTTEGTRRVRTYGDLLDGLEPDAELVLRRLVEGRLVTLMRGLDVELQEAEVELVHESLIHAWRRLARWIGESHDELSFLAELKQAAALWERRGAREDELWQRDALREASRWLDRATMVVPAVVQRFHEASQQQEQRWRRLRRLRRAGLTIALVATAAVSLVVAWAYSEKEQQAREARERAEQRRSEAQRTGARAALERGALIEARAMLRSALETRDSAQARALWGAIQRQPLAWRRTLGAYLYGLAYSPDGHQLAVACQDQSIYLLDTRTGGVRFLRGHTDQVMSVAFSPDGGTLASGTWGGEVWLWQLESGKQTVLRGPPSRPGAQGGPSTRRDVWNLHFSPDGALLAAASLDRQVHIFSVASGQRVRSLKHTSAVHSAAFSPDGKLLAAGDAKGLLTLWNVRTGASRAALRGHRAPVLGVAFSPDGRTLASCSGDRTVRLWPVGSPSLEASRLLGRGDSGFNSVAFSPDGSWVAAGASSGVLHLWRRGPGAQRHQRLEGHESAVFGVDFSPDGRRVASASNDRTVRVWRLDQAAAAAAPRSHSASVYGVAFSPDGKRLASGGQDRTIILWDVASGRRTRVLQASAATFGVTFSPDGKRVASAHTDGTVRLWDPRSGVAVTTLQAGAGLTDLAFSPDGKLLALGSQRNLVQLWELGAEKLRWKRERGGAIFGLAFSPDGELLVTGTRRRTVQLWGTQRGEARGELRGHKGIVFGVAFTPDGKQVVSGSADQTVRIWDWEAGTHRVAATAPARVYNIGLSHDGARVGAPCSDHIARLFPLAGGPAVELRGHNGEVNYLTFSPDDRLVATSSDDETVRLWDARDGRPLWRAPIMLTAPRPTLLSQRGWRDLEDGARRAPKGAWARAIEQRGRMASMATSGAMLCLSTISHTLELWNPKTDRRLASTAAPGLRQVVALPAGCLTLTGSSGPTGTQLGHARLVLSQGATHELSTQATAVAWDRGKILVATHKEVLLFDAAGRRIGTLPGRRGVRSMAHVGSWLALGNQDGNIELIELIVGSGRAASSVPFPGVSSSPVVRLLEGPMETLIAGFANGTVGIWSATSGAELETYRLHGPVRHMARRGNKLFVATELGDHKVLDLGVYLRSYCRLLREVWGRAPAVWEDDRALLRSPPMSHVCSRAAAPKDQPR